MEVSKKALEALVDEVINEVPPHRASYFMVCTEIATNKIVGVYTRSGTSPMHLEKGRLTLYAVCLWPTLNEPGTVYYPNAGRTGWIEPPDATLTRYIQRASSQAQPEMV